MPLKKPRFFTIEKQPLLCVEGHIKQEFKIVGVALAIKKGIEIQLWSPHMADPTSDCWFVVSFEYLRLKKTGASDSDVIITKGDQYYLARRDLGDTKLVVDTIVREEITKAIRIFSEKF